MDIERKVLRLGTAVILGAVLVRLFSGGVAGRVAQVVDKEAVTAAILFLQTGRISQPGEDPSEETVAQTEPSQPETEPASFLQPVILSREDAACVAVNNFTDYTVDVDGMLLQPLSWELTGEAPTVLIIHTHGSESYRNTEGYPESSAYRTLEEDYNVVSVGARVAELLEAGGVQVIHDRTLYDYPSYNGSYNQARKGVTGHLEANPSICLILDIHRDAMTDSSGNQVGYTVETAEGTAAKLMLVTGSDAGGLENPNWRANLSVAVKLQAVLERECPGICRPLGLRTGRFNQDLFPNMILVEMGAAGNTRQEALLTAEYLARGILAMAAGTASG